TQRDRLEQTEFMLKRMVKVRMSQGQRGSQNPVSQALLEKLQQGPNEPFRIDLLTRQNAATLRATFTGVLIQSVVELMGQQIMQQFRGGGEKRGSGGKSRQ